jgi:hypothetical protein
MRNFARSGKLTLVKSREDERCDASDLLEPDAVKVASPVVRPGKADVFSRR